MIDSIINDLLQREILKWVHKHASTKAMIVGNFAKSPDKQDRKKLPDWMSRQEFVFLDELHLLSSWFELGVHERKYYLRKNIAHMVERGAIITETHRTLYGNDQIRMNPGTVLDLLAAIDPGSG